MGRTHRPRSRICCWSPAITCGRAPAPTRCAATTTCRAPAITGAMPNFLPGYQSVDDPEVRARFEAGWRVKLPSTKGLDNHQMVDAIHEGKLKAHVLVRRRNEPGRLQRQLRGRRVRQARVLRRAGYFLQPTPAASPTWCCPPARAWKKKAPSPAPSGASSGSTRCSNRWRAAGRTGGSFRTSPTAWARIGTTSIPSENHGRDRVADSDVRRRELTNGWKDYKSLQWPVAATERTSRCSTPNDLPSPTARRGCSRFVPTEPTEQPDAEFDLHLNNGRLLEHFHEGNMTYRSARAFARRRRTLSSRSRRSWPTERGIQSGTWVQLMSRYGQGAGARPGHRPRDRATNSTCR